MGERLGPPLGSSRVFKALKTSGGNANVLNTLLTEDFVERAPAWWSLSAAGAASVVVALSWLWRPWAGVGTACTAVAVWLVLARVLAAEGTLVDPARPVAVAGLTVGFLLAGRQVYAVVERRRLAQLFAEYVPAAVAKTLIESGRAALATAGERLTVTVFFCDLRGFTATAARLAPADVKALLDTYYEGLSPVVHDHGGTLLQYTGDEIFAVFGAPLPSSHHADDAFACALSMFDVVPEVNQLLARLGLPSIEFGVGLHSGDVVAAHVGSQVRRQYAVIGDTVNVGSRFCSLARAGQITFSQATWQAMSHPPQAVPVGPVELKGVAQPMAAYVVARELWTAPARRVHGTAEGSTAERRRP